jgi:hypothetical protein
MLNILHDLKNRQNDVKDRFLLDVIEGLLGIFNNKLRYRVNLEHRGIFGSNSIAFVKQK